MIFAFLLHFISCKDQKTQLTEGEFWKYSSGFYIGDLLDFKQNTNIIQNDTLYRNNVPVALVIKIENRILSRDKVLHIQDLLGNEKGFYVEKIMIF